MIDAHGLCTHSVLYINLCIFIYHRSGYTDVIVVVPINTRNRDRVENGDMNMRNGIFKSSKPFPLSVSQVLSVKNINTWLYHFVFFFFTDKRKFTPTAQVCVVCNYIHMQRR